MSSVRIRFVENPDAPDAAPGDACWLSSGGPGVTITATGEQAPLVEHAALAYRCPGCNDSRSVTVCRTKVPHAWEWDGSVALPTLTPSIQHNDCRCKWHGYLTAGEFKSC